MKTLGVKWNVIKNKTIYKFVNKFEEKVIKNIFLNIARLYDPNRLIDFVIVATQLIM
jgi:hypothetical protein